MVTGHRQPMRAFTIVELLIVIVVIGILAAITIVAYNGIQERARVSSVSSALNQAAKKVAVWQVDNPSTSPTCTQFSAELGSTDTDCTLSVNSVEYQYTAGTNGTYCVTATSGPTSYKITESTKPTQGGCAGHGQGGVGAVTNLVKNPFIGSAGIAGWSGYNPSGGHTMAASPNSYMGRGAWRMTSGAAGIGSGTSSGYEYQGTGILVTAGTSVTPSVYVQASKAGTYSIFCQFHNGTTYVSSCPSNPISVPANTLTRLTMSAVTAPSGADRMTIRASYISGTTWATGDWFDVTMVSTAPGAYADGNTPNWVWNGSQNAAASTGPQL